MVLKNLSEESHTGVFLAKELEEVIKQVGPENFSAIVSDAEAKEKYPQGWKTIKSYLRFVPQPGKN